MTLPNPVIGPTETAIPVRVTPPVVGGGAAARYTQEQALEAGFPYEPEQVFGVLDLQAAYLHAIGAVGEVVDPEVGEVVEPEE